jgi:hypothetical protein
MHRFDVLDLREERRANGPVRRRNAEQVRVRLHARVNGIQRSACASPPTGTAVLHAGRNFARPKGVIVPAAMETSLGRHDRYRAIAVRGTRATFPRAEDF